MDKSKVLLGIIVLLLFFSLGFFVSQFYNFYKDKYFVSLSPNLTGTFVQKTAGDFLTNEDVLIFNDRIEIKINNSGLSSYDKSGSMSPTLDENSNGITIIPKSEGEIEIGDIISYEKNGELIVHRVIGKGTDEYGVYFVTKGDN